MNKYTFVYILFGFILVSCQKNQNDKEIITLVNETELIIDTYDKEVQEALDSSNYNAIKLLSITALDSTNSKIKRIENFVITPDKKEFQNSAISYMQSLRNIIKAEMTYANLTDSSSVESAMKLDSILIETLNAAKVSNSNYMEQLNTLPQ